MDPLTTASPPRQVKIDGTGFEDLISNLGLQDESPFLKMITNIKYYVRCFFFSSFCLSWFVFHFSWAFGEGSSSSFFGVFLDKTIFLMNHLILDFDFFFVSSFLLVKPELADDADLTRRFCLMTILSGLTESLLSNLYTRPGCTVLPSKFLWLESLFSNLWPCQLGHNLQSSLIC